VSATRRERVAPAGDLPLILFTSFTMMGAGSVGALPLLWLAGGGFRWPGKAMAVIAVSLLACGLLLSLSHLGRKRRMPLAILGLYRSPLSLEVLLVSVTIMALSGVLLFGSRSAPLLWLIAVIVSLLLLIVIGLVYRLKGQATLHGVAILAPLTTGLLWGLLLHAVFATISVEMFRPIVYLFIALDFVVTVLRWNTIERRGSAGKARNQAAFTRRRVLFIVRSMTIDLFGVGALLLFGPAIALISVSVGVLIDRYCFYALGVQLTTEAEVARIESIIREGTGE